MVTKCAHCGESIKRYEGSRSGPGGIGPVHTGCWGKAVAEQFEKSDPNFRD